MLATKRGGCWRSAELKRCGQRRENTICTSIARLNQIKGERINPFDKWSFALFSTLVVK